MSELTNGLRALADFFDQHPDLPGHIVAGVTVFVSADELATVARAMGTADKKTTDYSFELHRKFGPDVILISYTSRSQVCERVVTGTRKVERQVVPEGVELVTVVEDEEVVEWRCPDSILAPRPDAELVTS